MNQHAKRGKRTIVLSVTRPEGTAARRNPGHYAGSSSNQAGSATLLPFTRTTWFRASAAALLVSALWLQIGHARADGSLITTAVQVSLKIQQSCQIDSTDASGAAVAGTASSDSTTTLVRAASPAATSSSASAATASTLASVAAGQGGDVAPKVSCQFDEPYGVFSSAGLDSATRAFSGAASPSGDTIQVASWTVLF